jgi:hypothetical protein
MPITSIRGHTHYLLVIDVATRYIFLRALTDKAKHTVASVLFQLYCDFGFPKVLQSDNGTEFINDVMTEVKSLCRIDSRTITPYHHRANVITERAIRTTSEALFKVIRQHDRHWDTFLPSIQFFTNIKHSELHGSTPYSLMFARTANGFINYEDNRQPTNVMKPKDILHRLNYMTELVYPTIFTKTKKAHDKRNLYFMKNNRIIHSFLQPGARVFVKDELRSKKDDRYEGPFTIIRRNQGGAYVLKGPDGTEYTRPPSVLKLAHPDIKLPTHGRPGIIAAVQKILDHKEENNSTLYLVKWKDLPNSYNQWVPQHDFNDIGPIRTYYRSMGKNEPPHLSNIAPAQEVQAINQSNSSNIAPTQEFQAINQSNVSNIVRIPRNLQSSNLGKHWFPSSSQRSSKRR